MTQQTEVIEHPGRITNIGEEVIEVMILSASACAACTAKGVCNVSDMEEKIVNVKKPAEESFSIGQEVMLLMDRNLGFKAVFFGYILPFLLVVASLITVIVTGHSEGFAGLVALGILAVYYLIVYVLRHKLAKQFQFFIKS